MDLQQLPTCILLDLETSGVDPQWDKIIEVAIVKFQGDTVIDTYHTFVDPQLPIPQFITALTSITDEDVEGAPLIEDIVSDIRDFIGDHPIVGHSVQFDVNFLAENEVDLSENPVWDTYDLAGIALPSFPTYSLEALSDNLETKTKPSHRAIDDCNANAEVFNKLCQIISQNGKQFLEEAATFAHKAHWDMATLFEEIAKHAEDIPFNETSIALDFDIKTKEEEKTKFDEKKIIKLFEDEKKMQELLPDFQSRAPQTEMVQSIITTLENKRHACIEASTGTGKTLAYLIPTTYKALSQKAKVVVSTATINLQSQLADKDIPTLKKIIYNNTKENIEITAATLKGKSNYLCLYRFEALKKKEVLDKIEAKLLIKVLAWGSKTLTGDKNEINLQRGEDIYWKEMNCDSPSCKLHSADKCFLNKARAQAATANIIITNHALLLSDAEADNAIIPKYKYLVVDEAHHLESIATNQYARNCNSNLVQAVITSAEELLKTHFGQDKKPLVSDKEVQKICNELQLDFQTLSSKIDILLGMTGICIDAVNKDRVGSSDNILITEDVTTKKEFKELQSTGKHCNEIIYDITRKLQKVIARIDDEDNTNTVDEFKEELSVTVQSLDRISDTIFATIIDKDEADISWMSYKHRQKTTELNTAPLNVAEIINKNLFDNIDSIILTSATISINDSFDYIKEQLGLGIEWITEKIESNFDYYNNCQVVIPKDMPDPNSPTYQEKLHQIIYTTAKKVGGRTLALFTSNRAVEQAYKELRHALSNHGIEVLAQHVTGTRERIIEMYKKDPSKHIILGSSSFWEGVDLAGDLLKCVIITKIPFDVPDDPIFNARSALYPNAFMDYSIPRAVLKFKQGFGRLIRTPNDTGNVLLLDARLQTKRYGEIFLNSIPPTRYIHISHEDLSDTIDT